MPKGPDAVVQQSSIQAMLSEINDFRTDLSRLNERLFDLAGQSSSEYGDRQLQQIQSRLIWLQKVLNNSQEVLEKQAIVLKDHLDGKSKKDIKELASYYCFCEESAEKIKQKILNFFKETDRQISLYF